jgi:AraC-like DNA-binding protein
VCAWKTRSRLLNPNRRISEIAYDVGFQSLTQFNRTFKRVFGQSPRDFRAHPRVGQTQQKAVINEQSPGRSNNI